MVKEYTSSGYDELKHYFCNGTIQFARNMSNGRIDKPRGPVTEDEKMAFVGWLARFLGCLEVRS